MGLLWSLITDRITIIESKEFTKFAATLFTEAEKDDLLEYLSNHPQAGVLIKQSGGVRKLRWGHKGKGKSGGSRIIYYFHSNAIPIFVIATYAKNQQEDISPAALKGLSRFVETVKKHYFGE